MAWRWRPPFHLQLADLGRGLGASLFSTMDAIVALAKKAANGTAMDTVFSPGFVTLAIPLSSLLGIAFAVFLWQRVAQVGGEQGWQA